MASLPGGGGGSDPDLKRDAGFAIRGFAPAGGDFPMMSGNRAQATVLTRAGYTWDMAATHPRSATAEAKTSPGAVVFDGDLRNPTVARLLRRVINEP